mmetsp:Transcript_44234/g.87266  ORF Transcript_44234/g.87266 Transcript_44234/m.87266 type:complete len:233 (-) Transcript_44234:695-1393(-)
MAGSTMSGLFVAASTNTDRLSATPSISVNSWLTTLSVELLPSLPLAGQSASSSSKKITQGAETRALSNTKRTARSDSPTYLFRSSGPFTLMKLAPDSDATAFASSVFPHPGGPYRRTPAGTTMPSSWKSFCSRMGSQIESSSSLLNSATAPTSLKETSGIVANPSRLADGCTRETAFSKSSFCTARVSRMSGGKGPSKSGNCRRTRETASSAASLTTAERSAPTKPGVILAI